MTARNWFEEYGIADPYYADKWRVIVKGDCRAVLPWLPEKSVDLVLTDPPYGIDYQSAWRIDKTKWKPKIKNDKQPFVWFLPDVRRLLSDAGCLACFTRWDTEWDFRQAMRLAGITPKSQVIWDKEIHGMGDIHGDFAPRHENIIFAVVGKFGFPAKRPQSVIRSQRIRAEALVHPNEKPVELMRYLVESLCPINGVVLDPFLGGGSTLLVGGAYRYVGIELEERYCEIAANRCAADSAARLARGEY